MKWVGGNIIIIIFIIIIDIIIIIYILNINYLPARFIAILVSSIIVSISLAPAIDKQPGKHDFKCRLLNFPEFYLQYNQGGGHLVN